MKFTSVLLSEWNKWAFDFSKKKPVDHITFLVRLLSNKLWCMMICWLSEERRASLSLPFLLTWQMTTNHQHYMDENMFKPRNLREGNVAKMWHLRDSEPIGTVFTVRPNMYWQGNHLLSTWTHLRYITSTCSYHAPPNPKPFPALLSPRTSGAMGVKGSHYWLVCIGQPSK